jgi:hypothetical protein
LRNEARAVSTECVANGELAFTRQPALQQQMRYVAARYEKKKDDCAREQDQRLSKWKVVLRTADSNLWLEVREVRIKASRMIEDGSQFLVGRRCRCSPR